MSSDSSTSARAKADSGLIDLFAINREAKAAEQAAKEEALARARSEVPPPVILGPSPHFASDDVDDFAAAMSSPWRRVSKVKVAIAGGGVALLLICVAIFSSGGDSAKSAAMASPPPPATTAAPLPSTITPPAPDESVQATAAKPVPTTTAESPRAEKKVRKSSAPKRKVLSKGPKLQKVQSTGIPAT